jgi:hypothetical protein
MGIKKLGVFLDTSFCASCIAGCVASTSAAGSIAAGRID